MSGFLSEEDTKRRIIDPAIGAAGWSANQIMSEYNLRADRFCIVPDQNKTYKANSRTRADYLLCISQNFPLAVVEAKKKGLADSTGIDQAKTYAQMLDVPFAYSSSGEKFVEYDFSTGLQRDIPLDRFPSPSELWQRWCKAKNIQQEEARRLSDASYYTTADITPRYYQMIAINKVVDAVIAQKRKRALLVMATGTGKTYTAFQIVWRLRQAGAVKHVLYLADRNQLVDQTLVGDFAPFSKIQTKIKSIKKDDTTIKIDKNYEIYFGLYQQLKGNGEEEENEDDQNSKSLLVDHYKEVPPDYFDLIIVDECHRGSAREESRWRDILEYFKSAIHLGLTATPNEKNGANNLDYFGKPLYTYTLKQGIADGFLAPYQVVSVHLNKDETGWEPQDGEKDENGKLIPKRTYTLKDFGTIIELRNRTDKVAEMVTSYLQHLGPMSKTIIFCVTQKHALAMRDAMRKFNVSKCKENPNYIVRMTADDQEGKALYEKFTSVKQPYPVVVTTSKLLTTGADTKCVKLIVLDANISSMTEFKQIIGRGTRLREDAGKTFFTILDFRDACALFKDPAFDGDPDAIAEWGEGDPAPIDRTLKPDPAPSPGPGPEPKPKPSPQTEQPTYVVSGGEVTINNKNIQFLDENGRLVTQRFEDYTRNNILAAFKTEADFVAVWNGPDEKRATLELLEKKGVIFEELKRELGNPDFDEFDLVCSIAYGKAPLTRELRASKARRSKFLKKYQGVCRQVLETLIDIYARTSVANIDDRLVLKTEPFKAFGGPMKIVHAFGGKDGYLAAIKELERSFYVPEMDSNNNTETGASIE